MTQNTAIPIKASTQEHLMIEDIQDDIVLLKDGSCTLVVQVTAINFGLLSEGEQDAIIFAYAGLLNSLTFPIQIIVRSIGKDISEYLRLVREQELKQKKPLLLEQLRKYREFIEHTVKDNQVLDKKFYVALPFSRLELGLANSIVADFRKKPKLPYPKPYILEKAKMNLYPKRDHMFRQFGRLGLQSRQLNTQQLMELYYNLYNLESVGQKFVTSYEYANPIVQPAVGRTNPTPAVNPFQSAPTALTSSPMPTTPFPTSQRPHNTPLAAVPPVTPMATLPTPSPQPAPARVPPPFTNGQPPAVGNTQPLTPPYQAAPPSPYPQQPVYQQPMAPGPNQGTPADRDFGYDGG